MTSVHMLIVIFCFVDQVAVQFSVKPPNMPYIRVAALRCAGCAFCITASQSLFSVYNININHRLQMSSQ